MAALEANDFYYDKGRNDFCSGHYDQPFPNPMLIELDDFEIICNQSYNKGYHDEREGKSYDTPSLSF